MKKENKELIVWIIGLFIIRWVIVDTIIQNIFQTTWWVNYVITAVLYVIWAVILFKITPRKISEFINYKDQPDNIKENN